MGKLLIALAVLATTLCISGTHANRRGYIMTAPKVMQKGAHERVCFMFHQLGFDVSVNLTLKIASKNQQLLHNHIFTKGKSDCVTVIPRRKTSRPGLLIVEGRGVDSDNEKYHFKGNTSVTVNEGKLITFIETDKPVYKPGQAVKFRILSIKPNLKPRLKGDTSVWIENPNGVRMQQWLQPRMQEGLIDLEFPLSEEPVQGKWKIFVEIEEEQQSQEFEIKEYVLPKFEVIVKPPAFIMVDDKEVKVEICAKYSYGQPVTGTLMAEICITDPYSSAGKRPCHLVPPFEKIDGCKKLVVNSSALMLDQTHWSLWRARLKVFAAVTEATTGITLNATDESTKVERMPLKFDVESYTPEYYKPGLLFYGKVRVSSPDGRPAVNELITVKATNVKFSELWTKNFTTDQQGYAWFRLPPQKPDRGQFSVDISSPNHAYKRDHTSDRYITYQPRATHYMKQWYSPTGQFLQILPTDQSFRCGQQANITVTYTTSGQSLTHFHYQVLSRGNIVSSGHLSSKDAKVRPDVDENHAAMLVKLPSEPSASPEPVEEDDDDDDNDDEDEKPAIEMPPFVHQLNIPVTIQPNMSPSARILVYYALEDGEIIADSHEFSVEKCTQNQVGMTFSPGEAFPGEEVTMEISATPGSLCAVGTVDKSIRFLGNSNQITLDKVFAQLEQYELPPSFDYMDHYCLKKLEDKRPPPPRGPSGPGPVFPFLARKKRSIMPYPAYSNYVDAIKAFKNMGLVTLSDLVIETRPCELDNYYIRGRVYYSAVEEDGGMEGMPGPMAPVFAVPMLAKNKVSVPGREESAQSKALDIRHYFPETWLWSLKKIGSDGKKKISTSLPHTITDWVGGAFCTHPRAGLGVAPTSTVRGFQPFFASFNLPYSVIRGERVPIVVTVFNYLSECLAIKLSLKQSSFYRIEGDAHKKICVCGGKSDVSTFRITANKIGEIDLTVKAVSVTDEDVCNTNSVMSNQVGARDAVTRKLRVQAEGKEEEYSFSSFVCPKDGSSVTENVTLKLPDDLVEDSARATFSVMGDVMGSTLAGLENLVQYPSGCGEQNMVRFAPIISVMQYLTETDQLSEELKEKAHSYLHAGYQRELTYRHEDGSYSAFGSSDKEGSIWLTAFVLKSFAQAKKFIFIDAKDLNNSISYFRAVQLENGCFRQIGTVHHKAMKGGLGGKGTSPLAGLTAYIAMALMEAGIDKKDEMIVDAMRCLGIQDIEDMYTTALAAYTFSLYDREHPATEAFITKLNSMATVADGTKHWAKPADPVPTPQSSVFFRPYYQASSADVEMTAYAMMAYLNQDTDRSTTIANTLPIVRWLTKQRNAYGGFASTQDTVVALQALSKFATLAYGEGVNVTVKAAGQNFNKNVRIGRDNALVLQRGSISTLPNQLTVTTSGSGCAFVQASVKYNVKDVTVREKAFLLKVIVSRVKTGPKFCKRRKLDICTRYIGSDEASNMALVSIKMVSGWIPEKDSIKRLMNDVKLDLKRYEIEKDHVHLYFQELTRQMKCMQVTVYQNIEVSGMKPALVEVYDYYDTELEHVSQKYEIKQTCGTKEEIPYETNTDDGFVGQVRVYPTFPSLELGGSLPKESCPRCLNSRPDSLIQDFCQAKHAYKLYLRGPKRIQLKLLSDLRPAKMKRLNLYVRYTMPSHCQCLQLLKKSGTKLVALMKTTELQPHRTKKKEATVELSDDVTLVPLDRMAQRDMMRAARSGTCNTL